MMTYGSLFAGIGGMDLGLERAGMTCRWQVEIDPYCRGVLAKHWPDVERFEDVREVGKHNLRAVDLVCGGFPCQPVSCAGKRKGAEDERWLWPEFARVVREIRPRWVLGENVPGLLSMDAGRIFGGVLRDLAACGYAVEWDCIPAAAVGAPHRRDRVFILARRERGATGPRCGSYLADTGRMGKLDKGQPSFLRQDSASAREGGEAMADDDMPGFENLQGQRPAARSHGRRFFGSEDCEIRASEFWSVEPDVGRVADGVPKRVDRLRGLGNAVVPQVAEWIGRRITGANKP